MNTTISRAHPWRISTARESRLVLLGTGGVGRAFVQRHQRLLAAGHALPTLAVVANSRGSSGCRGDAVDTLRRVDALAQSGVAVPVPDLGWRAGDVVVDATASDAVAARHAPWLERGIHVVTANKLGVGATLSRARAIQQAAARSGAGYGDSATVGAGLPVLRTLRALLAGGDRIHSIEGVLSGSMAWLFRRFDGEQSFSALLHRAQADGYTEPDPRIDLGGEDVRRKLLILARAVGVSLDADDVQVESLVPAALLGMSGGVSAQQLATLDAPMAARLQQARAFGRTLCVVGRLEFQDDKVGHASVGLRDLPSLHPLSGGIGTDNCVAIHSCRYREQPLLIQGPGAGADVTAAALLDDVARIARDVDSARNLLEGWQARQVGVERLGPVNRKTLGVVDAQLR